MRPRHLWGPLAGLPPAAPAPAVPPAAWLLPAGVIVAFAGEVSPLGAPPGAASSDVERAGWMICDGRALRIAQYPELFAAIAFRYARRGEPTCLPPQPEAAAAATFRIPDLRGTFLRGANGDGAIDGVAGADPDPQERRLLDGTASHAVGSRQRHALQKHEHRFAQVSQATGGAGGPVAGLATEQGETVGDPLPQDNAGELFSSAHETRPGNVAVHYLIRTSNFAFALGGWP